MILESLIKTAEPGVVRSKQTSAGMVIEVDGSGKPPTYPSTLYEKLSAITWDSAREIIYSLTVFSSPADRFVVDATIREQPTTYSFNMATSILGVIDIYCKFTKYDFDVLTLSNRDDEMVGYFVIDDTSLCKKPLILYKELDIQGFQFPISSKAKPVDGHFEIVLAGNSN
jgi:hypothetical protein